MIRAIAIQNYGSSGTTFVHSLLDNHPQVLQLPGLRGGEFYNFWRQWVTTPHGPITAEVLRNHVLGYFLPLCDPAQIGDGWGLQELGLNHDQHPCVPQDQFIALFDRYLGQFSRDFGIADTFRLGDLPRHRRAHLYAVYHAYETALGRDMSAKRYLVYPIHSALKQDLMDLRNDFAQVFILHMVRNPINNLNSVFKYYLRARTLDDPTHDIFSSGLHAMFRDRALNISPSRAKERLHGLYFYDDAVRSNSRAVRLEDLHRNPEAVMRRLADWVGLQWDPVLLESTFGGHRWWNRPGLSRVSGFSPAIVSKEAETHTTPFDEGRLRFIGQPIVDMYYCEGSRDRWGIAQRMWHAAGCLLPFSLERASLSSVRARIVFAQHLKRVLPACGARLEQAALRDFEQDKRAFDPGFHVLMPVTSHETPESPEATAVMPARVEAKGLTWVARAYVSLLDYVRHRLTIAAAIRFVRANKDSQVPLLFEVGQR